MAYRDESEPLKEQHASLATALEQVRSQSRALAAEERALSAELDRVSARLDGAPRASRARARFVVAALAATTSCALLAVAGFARLQTSEIAPFALESSQSEARVPTTLAVTNPSSVELGTLRVDAAVGSRVYEDHQLLGTTPLVMPLPYGVHAIRVVSATGASQSKLAFIWDRDVTALRFD